MWLMDSRASHHVANDLQNLSLHSNHAGIDEIVVGNDQPFPIANIGSTILSTPFNSFSLNNIFCVPSMTHNSLSMSKFCQSNNVAVEFYPHFFFLVMDL